MTGRGKNLDQVRWQRVLEKDTGEDATFYYAVMTTGVYCRPGCKARTPRRHNVEFFDSAEDAEQHGYRPCKKCSPGRVTNEEIIREKIVQACRYIERTSGAIALKDLAAQIGMSPYHFHRCFKKAIGITPHQYYLKQRADRLKQSLAINETVAEAAFSAGFESLSGAYNNRIDQLGMPPGTYRDGGQDIKIIFEIARCSLGFVLVALTSRGICAVELGDDPVEMAGEFKKRFPQSKMEKGDETFQRMIEAVVKGVENPEILPDLPIDIQGTAFQHKVWNALRSIEPGKTCSYSEVAEMIGKPMAVRAVANACAANKIAVLIPCHRVLTKNDKISGYRWGKERKEELLKREKKKTR